MSHRKAQIEAQLKRVLSTVLAHELSDPRVTGMVSVTHVDVAPDLHEAFVYVSILPQEHESKTMHGLKHAAGHIHTLAFKRMALRRVPKLVFRLDSSLKRSEEVFGAINKAMKRTGPNEDTPETGNETETD